jgi:anthraniloyl-CoA monooxygenase
MLGGGPGGLYAARLLKLARPELEIRVYERNDPAATFGFGVALTGATQRNLAGADHDSYESLARSGVVIDAQAFRLPAGQAAIRGGGSLGIGRAALLGVLLEHAEHVGVELVVGHRDPGDVDADVVVASDGMGSATRTKLETELGARVEVGRGLYLWCGTDFALPHNLFIPVTTEHGMFVAHAYPYAADRSTVLIETDERTWRKAGFDLTTASLAGDPSGSSDETSLAYLEDAFRDHLDGHPLLGNRTRWLRFNTVSCQRWHHGRTVLLGDAAHTAHYSLGSGTKLAMEDAIALAGALAGSDNVPQAFSTYEAVRRPAVARIQHLARRSQLWWESFSHRAGLAPAQMALAFMTRAGNVSVEQLAATNPDLVTAGLVELATDDGDEACSVLGAPLEWQGRRFPGRVLSDPLPPGYRELDQPTPGQVAAARAEGTGLLVARLAAELTDAWGPEADQFTDHVEALVTAGCDGLRLTDGGDRGAVLDRLALAERLRLATGALLVVEGAADLEADLVAGVAGGRTDLVAFTRTPIDLRRTGPEAAPVRIGLIVPSSNVTVEREMAALLSRHPQARFSFHGSRMRMGQVTATELAAMNAQAARCVDEVADAGVDAVLYGCLVAVMAQGRDEHRRVETAVTRQLTERGLDLPAVSSAGALVEALGALSARRIALITPYLRPLAQQVVAYLEGEGFTVADWVALEEPDNAAVACIPGDRVMAAARQLDLTGVDALVISACVQMPSLDLVQPAEETFGLPVISAATAAAYVLLNRLGLRAVLPDAGSLLAGGAGVGAAGRRTTRPLAVLEAS